MEKKCVILLSGGLDSLLAVKIMQEQNFSILAIYFKLPFSKDISYEIEKFSIENKIKLKIIDCTKHKLLQEYLNTIRNAKFGRGKGTNPCIDCKIFLLKKAKQFADKKKINLIVTGEVINERPFSQTKKALKIIEDETKLNSRILRPLSAKLLQETNFEKEKIINKENFYSILGKNRKKQIQLAKKFNISYPQPAGGCLLCEKILKKRFKFLLNRGINSEEIKLINIGRHFLFNNCWVVIGRNERENKIIEKIGNKKNLIIPDYSAPSAIIDNKCKEEIKEKVKELIKTYSKRGNLKKREKWERYKL